MAETRFYNWMMAATGLFATIHESRAFDLATMIPYLFVAMILATYGLHRTWLVYAYIRYRRNVPRVPPAPARWPKVTIQLPIYNERYVIERLIDAVAKFDYPWDLLDIQVLDDSTDETQEVARACVERHRATGLPIRHLHRTNRNGFKAGALAAGLDSATGEFIAIFDADFIPNPDFLRRTIPYLSDPTIGMVQTRWTYLNGSHSLLTRIQTVMLDGYFGGEHLTRSRSGLFFHFTGTAGVWRRSAIDDAGGWQQDTLTEDIDLSFRAELRGWRLVYLSDVECPSELPVEMNAFKEQQARWAKGSMQVALKILPQLLRSKENLRIKAEALFNLSGSITTPLVVVLLALSLPTLIVRLSNHEFRSIWVDVPCAVATVAVIAFFLGSQYALYPRTWYRGMFYLPLLFAVGIGISLRIAKGVLEALWGIKSDFVRTPKFNTVDGRAASWHVKQYRNRAGWLPYLEIAFGLYSAFTLLYSIENRNYKTVPFFLTCIFGFTYVGAMSLAQRWWATVRTGARPYSTQVATLQGKLRNDDENVSNGVSVPATVAVPDESGL